VYGQSSGECGGLVAKSKDGERELRKQKGSKWFGHSGVHTGTRQDKTRQDWTGQEDRTGTGGRLVWASTAS
jgi:hypothetical protein